MFTFLPFRSPWTWRKPACLVPLQAGDIRYGIGGHIGPFGFYAAVERT